MHCSNNSKKFEGVLSSIVKNKIGDSVNSHATHSKEKCKHTQNQHLRYTCRDSQTYYDAKCNVTMGEKEIPKHKNYMPCKGLKKKER